jgi:hypothetical protein
MSVSEKSAVMISFPFILNIFILFFKAHSKELLNLLIVDTISSNLLAYSEDKKVFLGVEDMFWLEILSILLMIFNLTDLFNSQQ